MKSIIKYILLNAIRDKVYLSIFLALIAVFSIAIFLGNTSLVEQAQTSSIYIAGASRFVVVFGMILFVCLNIAKAFENKEVEFIISKPVSREKFILSYLIGFFITAAIIIIALSFVIIFVTKANLAGTLIWLLSLFCEILIVISFALLASLVLKNAFLSIIASIAFYLISRMMGLFVMAIDFPQNFAQFKGNFLALTLKILSIPFPRLDLFTQSSWLIYGDYDLQRIWVVFLQSLIYICLMVFMSFHDVRRKQF
jgi:ABC-type transport system involved in multi-copper enzyme maturation permease subunit